MPHVHVQEGVLVVEKSENSEDLIEKELFDSIQMHDHQILSKEQLTLWE